MLSLPHRIVAKTQRIRREWPCSRRILATLPPERFHALASAYPSSRWLKYTDMKRFVPFTVWLCNHLGLIESEQPVRILDIGCGSGLFLYCAGYLGHSGVGLDVEDPLLGAIAEALNVDRRISPILPFQPLPHELGKFGLVTAMGTVFDRYGGSRSAGNWWGAGEWHFLLEQIAKILEPTGRLFLRINRGAEAKSRGEPFYSYEVHEALRHGHQEGISYLFDRHGVARAIENLGRRRP